MGEFATGTISTVFDYWTSIKDFHLRPLLPMEILPQPSKPLCKGKCGTCVQCKKISRVVAIS